MKKTRLTRLLFLLLALIGRDLFSQEIPELKKENLIEQRIENLADGAESSDADYINLLDELLYYRNHPLDLNQAGMDELSAIGLFTDLQISALLNHRKKAGPLIAIYELQAVEGFPLDFIYQITPYIRVADRFDNLHLSFQELMRNGQHQIVSRVGRTLEKQEGYLPASDSLLNARPNARYLGDPNAWFFRYRFSYGTRVSVSFTGDKDAGEQFLKGAQKNGFDFYSGHVAIRNVGAIKALVLGDYVAQFGQGLTMWMGQGFGKTSDPALVKRNGRGIVPSNSFNESLFFRGAALTLSKKGWETSAFVSRKKIDANVTGRDSLDFNTPEEVSSLMVAGLHRTPSEIESRKTLGETVLGANAGYRSRSFSFGLTGSYLHYAAPLVRDTTLVNQFEFRSDRNTVLGTDYNWIFRNFNFFGEVSRSANGGIAQIHGALVSLDPKLLLSLHYRNFSRNFQNTISNAVAEGARTINEEGMLMGMTLRPTGKISLAAYYDLFSYPWLKTSISRPGADGNDFFCQLNFTPNRKTDMYIRYRRRIRMENASGIAQIAEFPQAFLQENIRANFIYPVSPVIRLRNRIEWVNVRKEGNLSRGFIIFQDISYKPLSFPVSFSARYILFDTDDYDSRIYSFESDMLYAFSIPAYYDKGNRFYLLLNYQITRYAEIWVRYAVTSYLNRSVISEGSLNEINGNRRTDLKVQLRISL